MAVCYNVPSSLLSCVITDVQLGRVISQGAYGRILEAKWEGSVVVVKQIQTAIFEKASVQELEGLRTKYLLECDRTIKLRHPNIVRIFGVWFLPGVRIPSVVMEPIHCSLKDLLEQNSIIHLDIKMSILHQIGLGLRYLHTRIPPITHCNLSSKKIMISKGIEAKIAYLSTIQFLESIPMDSTSGFQDFMAPEILVNGLDIKYGKELDVFSFGCVMLHTFSQQWPTPSQHVVTDRVECKFIARSEIERRAQYLDKIHKAVKDKVAPLIVRCLKNLPSDRPTIMEVCDQLETLVVNKQSLPDNLLQAQQLLQEMTRQIHSRDVEIETLRSNVTKLQAAIPPIQVCKLIASIWYTVEPLLKDTLSCRHLGH